MFSPKKEPVDKGGKSPVVYKAFRMCLLWITSGKSNEGILFSCDVFVQKQHDSIVIENGYRIAYMPW
jgi:hypothetical protein